MFYPMAFLLLCDLLLLNKDYMNLNKDYMNLNKDYMYLNWLFPSFFNHHFPHSFPLGDKDRLQQWLVNIRRDHFKPSPSSRICSHTLKTAASSQTTKVKCALLKPRSLLYFSSLAPFRSSYGAPKKGRGTWKVMSFIHTVSKETTGERLWRRKLFWMSLWKRKIRHDWNLWDPSDLPLWNMCRCS